MAFGRVFGIDPWEHAFQHAQIGLALIDGDGVIRRANPAGAAIAGRTVEDLVGRGFAELMHPDDLAVALAEQEASLAGGHGRPVHVRIARPTGEWVWLRGHGTRLPVAEPTIFVVFEDVTEELEAAERARRAEALSTRRAEEQEAVATLGREALTGAVPLELATHACEMVMGALDVHFAGVLLEDEEDESSMPLVAGAGVLAGWAGRYRHPRDARFDLTLAQREPTLVTDIAAEPVTEGRRNLVAVGIRAITATPIIPRNATRGILITGTAEPGRLDAEDITFLESMANVLAHALDAHDAVDELRFSALHDALTGLPNRTLLLDRLELALEHSASAGCQVAVLVCDLDRFKVVNDGMGHAAGDDVLCIVAERLQHQVRPGDTVGRFGGDEFVVVCPEIDDPAKVIDIAERLAAVFRSPMSVGGSELVATASVGIALGTEAGADAAATLLRDADAAMYRAKSRGRARYEIFDDEMRAWAAERLRTESDLRRGLTKGELVLHYQPVVSVRDGSVAGVEALVRWEHPDRGLLLPGAFLEVAADAGILPELGAWAVEEACRQTAAWAADGRWGGRWTAVNLSGEELGDARLVERISDAMGAVELDPLLMRVELTEQALIEDAAQAAAVLDDLRARGVGISVDDFGTGYSSLAYLRRLPVDCLKLDRVFVAGLGARRDDELIADAVVRMAHALGLDVVAEGVETEAQLGVVRALGCDQAQGHLFAAPMPPGEVLAWIERRPDLT